MHFSSAGWVGTCDTKWRRFLSFRRTLTSLSFMKRTLVCFAFSWIHGRGNVVLERGSGPCFETLTSSSVPQFFPQKRGQILDLSDWTLTATFTTQLLCMRKKNYLIFQTHTFTETESHDHSSNPTGIPCPVYSLWILTRNYFWFSVFSSWRYLYLPCSLLIHTFQFWH